MAYLTYRVELTGDESRASRDSKYPDHRLYRPRSRNERAQYTGDFESLSEALAAIETAYPS
jgi:hypothetical protein